jgi:excisionase family DNA binding protein
MGEEAAFEVTHLTVKQLAEHWGLQPDTIKKWARKRIIPAIKLGRDWRFSIEAIENFERKNSTGVRN